MQATAHASYWQETSGNHVTHFPALDGPLTVDVAIIGGGITGLTAAWHLAQAGQKVAILEAGQLGQGTTGYSSAHLDATGDTPLPRLIFDFGEERAATVAAALRDSIDHIELRSQEYGDCEFRRLPSYQFTESVDGLGGLQQQCAAGTKLGYTCWFTRQVPLPFSCVGAVQVAHQARIQPYRYLQGLAAEVHALGGEIFENTSCLPPQVNEQHVDADGGRVTARAIFIATHSPFLGISQFDFRVFAYQSYLIAARVDDPPDDALFWDDADPYHYIRLASPADPNLVLIGGADHKTGHPGDERQCYDELEHYAAQRFSVQSIEHRWSAQHFVPADGLPHIGRVPGSESLYLATGFAGVGLTWGTVAGALVARQILGQEHPLTEVVAPARFTPAASATSVISENLDVIRRFTADRLFPESASEEEIAPGCGCVIRQQGKLQAVYRDVSGELHRLSPVCPHAGCIVHYNDAERTWDCPCHGSRFTALGQRFAGPSPRGLDRQHSSGD